VREKFERKKKENTTAKAKIENGKRNKKANK
jgi:hypothetical protein